MVKPFIRLVNFNASYSLRSRYFQITENQCEPGWEERGKAEIFNHIFSECVRELVSSKATGLI